LGRRRARLPRKSHLRLALDAYTYEYSGLQIDYFDAAHIVFVTRNAGTSTAKGVEFEGEWAPPPVPGLVLRGTIAYNKTQYKSFAGAPCWGGQTIAQGCNGDLTFSLSDGINEFTTQNLSGKPTALAPEWTGAFEANYEHPVSESLVFGASANLRYSSSYFANPWANPFAKQSAYTTVDASLRLRTRDSHWELAVIGKNLTDEYVSTFLGDMPSSGKLTGTAAGVRSDLAAAANLPRTIQVQVTWKY